MPLILDNAKASLLNCVALITKGEAVSVRVILVILLILACKSSNLIEMLAELSLMVIEVT